MPGWMIGASVISSLLLLAVSQAFWFGRRSRAARLKWRRDEEIAYALGIVVFWSACVCTAPLRWTVWKRS